MVNLWTPQELSTIQDNYVQCSAKELAEKCARSEKAIYQKAQELGLYRKYDLLHFTLIPFHLGYFIALTEGEGGVGISKCKSKYQSQGFQLQPYIAITNTSLDLLKEVQCVFKGQYGIPCYIKKMSGRKDKRWKQCYVLIFGRLNVIYSLLMMMKPHLIVKRKQAELMIQFCKSRLKKKMTCAPYDKRELKIHQTLKELNARRGKIK